MPPANRRRGAALSAAFLAVFLAVYGPAAGRGFVKDDFGWIAAARADGWADVVGVFSGNVGFYRPLVTLTFTLDHALWRLSAAGYGATNLLLCLAGAALLYGLVRRLELPRPAAVAAAATWLLNFHAVNMAVLWLSGRTALLLVVCALATAHAMLRHRTYLAGLCCLCALLSKEEAVLLPLLWTVARAVSRAQVPAPSRMRAAIAESVRHTWPLWAALGIYGVLRSRSGAFSPSEAPSYYQFSFDPQLLFRNVLEYADRAGTTAAIVILVLVAAAGWRRLRVESAERRALRLAVLWIPAAYALTVFLPVRSSLYALFPSIGSALVVAAVASAALRANPIGFRRASLVLLALAVLLVPVYDARNARWTDAADLSARVMALVRTAAAQHRGGHIVLIDDPDAPVTLGAAFSSGFPTAVPLFAGPGWSGEIVETDSEIPSSATIVAALRGEMLTVVRE